MKRPTKCGVHVCRVCVLSAATLFALACLCGVAIAASPAWKLLAVTGPTHIPPTQSELQRVSVEAEGGTFELGYKASAQTSEGAGTPVFVEAELSFTEGSTVATIESITGSGKVEPGDRLTLPEEYEENLIVSCSADCETTGSTIELTEPAAATETGAVRQIFTRELTSVTGSFEVGEEIYEAALEGSVYEYFVPGTKVTAVGPGTLTLSNPTTIEYASFEGELELFGKLEVPAEFTGPLAFNATPGEVQEALETLPRLGPGSIQVLGGPGGSGETPYRVLFDGPPVRNTNVAQIEALDAGLEGPAAAAHVLTDLQGGPGTGEILVAPANIGGSRTQKAIRLKIGPLPAGIVTTGSAEGAGWECPESFGAPVIECTSYVSVSSLRAAEAVHVPIAVESPLPLSTSVPVQISGGSAASSDTQAQIEVSATPATFGPSAFWAGAFDSDGQVDSQAGGHPFSAQTYFMLNTVRARTGAIIPAGAVSEVNVDLPAGFSGNPLATGRCPQDQLVGEGNGAFPLCNVGNMGIGHFAPLTSSFAEGSSGFDLPIYNDVPARGSAAEFSTKVILPTQSLLGSIRSEEDFGVRITAPNVTNYYKLFGAYAALEGEPSSADGRAFLTNPTSCSAQAHDQPFTVLTVKAYEQEGSNKAREPIPPVTGCDRLKFGPAFEFQPSTTQGSAPAGGAAHLHISQAALAEPGALAPPALKKAVVTLPAGLTVNPSSANGLKACTEAQVGFVGMQSIPINPTRFNNAPVTCPDASKIGTFSIKTPLLDENEAGGKLEGTIYLAEQEENPFHSLIALYLVLENERFGLTLKLPGEVKTDSSTGQLTATFDNNPQLPFEDLTLNFRGGGPRSTLATPEVCGHYATNGSFEPWSAPESGPPAQISEGGFEVDSGCASSESTRAFAPSFEAGTTGTQAASYSPLVIKVGRKDGEQELRSLDFTLPKGLLARLAGIPYCSEGAIHNAEHNSGKSEQSSPSCPAASRIGSVDTAAGVGSEPLHVSGSVYLAGPYRGAPLSSVVVTPAVAGPFDLGDVVVRAPLYVDPETTEVTAKSDPIPTILKGIPLKVRSVAINLDRPSFALNPTSCNVMEVSASIGGSSGATAKPANRFQVGGCKGLKFKPHLKIRLKGQTKHTGFPALKAVVTYPKHGIYANIQRAQVNLPHSEFLEQNNLNKTCTKPVLLEGKCPKSTAYGRAEAWSPLLDKPLRGLVYLVGGYGYKLPALVADLSGQIRVLLKGKIDSGPNGGIRTTFEMVPDAPVSRFMLQMKGGKKYGLLVNSENLCKASKADRLAIARFRGQNGRIAQYKPVVTNECGKAKKHGASQRHERNSRH